MMIGTKATSYHIKVEYDSDPLDPRKDYDNFGNMICWHRRYNLGDEHNYENPRDFLEELVRESVDNDEVISFVQGSKCDTVKLEYDRSAKCWNVSEYDGQFKKWFTDSFDPPLKRNKEQIAEALINVLPNSSLIELTEKYNVILPLYLYDHSGITMNTSGFSCRWDSGQVGWIYATHDEVKKEYGAVNEENLQKAEDLLKAETKTYDYYLRGDCYGYTVSQDGAEIDSCWGFLGDLRDVLKDMKEYVPEDVASLFDHLDYCKMEYCDEQQDNEDEEEY